MTEHNPAPSPSGRPLLSGLPTLTNTHRIFTHALGYSPSFPSLRARQVSQTASPDFTALVASWFSKPFSQGGTLTTVGWAFLAARLAARDRGSIPRSGTASAPPLFEGCRRRQAPHRVRSPPSMCATPAALSTYSEPLTPLPHTPVFTSLIWALPPLSHQPLTRAGRFRFQPPPTSFTRRCATFVTTL